MSNPIAIRLACVSKMFKTFPGPLHNFLDAFGISWLLPWKTVKPREFWAVREISIDLERGSRLGIIGRNGAGKSTMLKLISGNLTPTEGEIEVNGQIQALLEMGAGFHPEFTGYENIRAALTYQGMRHQEIEEAIRDIAEFTELGDFLGQQFKTYSSGMQARLTFSTATVLKPEILIVDEILGAGDAYFAGKSNERMKQLVEESGATVLLVSHSMESVIRFTDECIWIERGRIVMRGSSMEVVKAYEEFIRKLEDRRLKARNLKRQSNRYDLSTSDVYADTLMLTFQLQGNPGTRCDITEVALIKDGQVEDTLKVGDGQDTNRLHTSLVGLDGNQWSEPIKMGSFFCRSIEVPSATPPSTASGHVFFYLWSLEEDSQYDFRVRYRCDEAGTLSVLVTHNGREIQDPEPLPVTALKWGTRSIPLMFSPPPQDHIVAQPTTAIGQPTPSGGLSSVALRRWPSDGSIVIESVRIMGEEDVEQAVFHQGKSLRLKISCKASRSGTFPVIAATNLYRMDGICASQNISAATEWTLVEGERKELTLTFPFLDLGNGRYVFSVALYRKLDPLLLEEVERYDLIDRAYEIEIVGNPPLRNSLCHLPADWKTD